VFEEAPVFMPEPKQRTQMEEAVEFFGGVEADVATGEERVGCDLRKATRQLYKKSG
jgi:hypothetical protein